jgi:hypothetical protein
LPPAGFPSGRPSVSAICEVTAEVNHLRPYSRHAPFSSIARVCERPTSEPPVVSVIHWPLVQKVAGSRAMRCGTAWAISRALPDSIRVRAAPSVIASGHEYTSVEGWNRKTLANCAMRACRPSACS